MSLCRLERFQQNAPNPHRVATAYLPLSSYVVNVSDVCAISSPYLCGIFPLHFYGGRLSAVSFGMHKYTPRSILSLLLASPHPHPSLLLHQRKERYSDEVGATPDDLLRYIILLWINLSFEKTMGGLDEARASYPRRFMMRKPLLIHGGQGGGHRIDPHRILGEMSRTENCFLPTLKKQKQTRMPWRTAAAFSAFLQSSVQLTDRDKFG